MKHVKFVLHALLSQQFVLFVFTATDCFINMNGINQVMDSAMGVIERMKKANSAL